MKAFDQGAYYRVTCQTSDVREWASKWPCYGPIHSLSFTYCKRTGDLVDVHGDRPANDPQGILALSIDAQSYGRKRLNLML